MRYKFLVYFLVSSQLILAQQQFSLKGKVKNVKEGFIFLNYENAEGKPVHDSSAIVPAGGFSFAGTISGPTMAYLSYGFPSSYVTDYMLRYHVGDFSWEKLAEYYNKLGIELQQSRYGKYVKEEIEKLKAGSPGAIANDFSKDDINGVAVSLSEFKG